MSAKYSPDSSSDSISAEIDLASDDFSDGATGDEEFDSDTLYSSSSDVSAAHTEFSLLLSPDLYRALNVTGAMPKKARFATPLSRKRKHPDRKQWSPSVRSKTLRDVLDETLPNFQDEANDYSEGEWFKMMHDTAEYASCGKRERAFLMKEPADLVARCTRAFNQFRGHDVIVQTCKVLINICHSKEQSHRESLAGHASLLVPMLLKALRCRPATEEVLKVFAELSYQCKSFAENCSEVIPVILQILEDPKDLKVAGQACKTLCNLCFEVHDNRKAVVEAPLCQDRQFMKLLERCQPSKHKFCEQVIRLLTTLISEGGFRALIGVEDVNRFLKVPWGNSDVAEAICVFLNSLLMSDTPMDDGRQAQYLDLFNAEQCLTLISSVNKLVARGDDMKNSCVKRCLILLKNLLEKPVREHDCLLAVVNTDVLNSTCVLLDMGKKSAVNVRLALEVLSSLITPETEQRFPGLRDNSKAVAEKVQRLKGVMPQGSTPDGSREQEEAVSELLRSLGHLKSSDSPSAPKPTHPAATKASSPAASPKGKRKRTSSTSPPLPQGPQSGWRLAQPKKVDVEKAVGHTLEQKDTTNVRRFRISICGQFSTGKTSLFDSLRNKNFVLEKKSTLVATVQDSIFVEGGLTDTTISAADYFLRDVKERILEEERIRTENEKLRKEQVDLEREQRRAAEDLQRTQDLAQQQHTPVITPFDKSSNPGKRAAAPLPARSTSGRPELLGSVRQPGRTQPDPSLSTTITPPVYERRPRQSSQRRTERSKSKQVRLDINRRQLHEEFLQNILDDKEIMRTIESSEVVVSTWDSGGQSVFSSIQHLLMGDDNVIYVLCFNSSEQLHEVKEQMYISLGPDGTERKVRAIEVPECLRNIDHIRHWLTAIHFAKKDDSPIPPVIFVGTFADMAIEKSSCTMEEFKEGLWRNLQGYCKRSPTFQAMEDDTFSTHGPDSLHLVDNTVSGTTDTRSDDVQALSNHLQKAMDAVLEGSEIKKDWLRFEWVLQRLRNHRQKTKSLPGYIDHEYAAELAAKVCNITDANEVEDMLQYYDQLRLIIYRPNSASKPAHASFLSKESNARIVVYDVAWLIEKFNDLIYGPEFTGKIENPEGTVKPKDKAPSHRHTLWTTGVLSSTLINTSWNHLKDVTDQLLEIMVSFELFYPNGNESYLVPFALQVRPDPSILESMREESDVISGARMAITTCDIPLLIKAHPDDDMCYEEDPDIPLPHSDYFFLLVRLMQKWKITRPDRSVRLQYNSAWMAIPNASLGLHNFHGCSVSVFLAHYEISGAILLSACIEQDTKSFKPSHVSSHDGKSEKIANVLCNIRQAVIDIVRDLHGSKRPRPKLFLLPFPPACGCREENTDKDLGNAHWKIPIQGDDFAPTHEVEASVHGNNDEPSTQKSVMERLPSNGICQSCGDVYNEPCNGNAWFNRESNFVLEKRNEKAATLFKEFQLELKLQEKQNDARRQVRIALRALPSSSLSSTAAKESPILKCMCGCVQSCEDPSGEVIKSCAILFSELFDKQSADTVRTFMHDMTEEDRCEVLTLFTIPGEIFEGMNIQEALSNLTDFTASWEAEEEELYVPIQNSNRMIKSWNSQTQSLISVSSAKRRVSEYTLSPCVPFLIVLCDWIHLLQKAGECICPWHRNLSRLHLNASPMAVQAMIRELQQQTTRKALKRP